MKTLATFFGVLSLLCIANARDPEKVELWRLEQFTTADWMALSFGFERSHGDYYSIGRSIVLQRLPDDRVALSLIKDGNHDLPVIQRIVTLAEAENIRTAIGKFHSVALAEQSLQEWVDTHDGDERLSLMKKHFPHGYVYTKMVLRITKVGGDTIRLRTNFDEKKDTLQKYTKYFDRALKPTKGEQTPEAKGQGK